MSRSVVAGYRFFECDDCGHKWKEKCRDAQTPSMSYCPKASNEDHPETYGAGPSPVGWELHPEWPTDLFGNLILPFGEKYGREEPWDGKFPDA